METITIPKKEYLDMIFLFQKIKEKFDFVINFNSDEEDKTEINVMKYCGTISLKEDALEIQNKMRDEWEQYYY